MVTGALALLERSLRLDSRAWGPHLARFGLMIAIYGAVILTLIEGRVFGAPGLWFLHSMAFLNLVFISLLGLSYFSTAITEEKEEDTLGLMLMAGISPLGILFGKSGSRLLQAMLMVAIQYPFTVLAITMGGVMPIQVQAMYLGMVAYVVMLAGIGLFCSTISARNKIASMRLMVIVFAYILIPAVCSSMVTKFPSLPVSVKTGLSWIGDTCIFLQIGTIMTTGYGESIVSRQVISNLILGVAGFFCSWVFFEVAANQPSTEAIVRGAFSRSGLFSPPRPWPNPIIWKDFYFVGGGGIGILLRMLVSLGAFLGAWLFDEMNLPLATTDRLERIYTVYYVFMCMVVPVDAGYLAARSLSEEIRAQTLTSLFLLPIPLGRLLYSKLLGAIIPWLPGPCCLLGCLFLFPGSKRRWEDCFREPVWFVWGLSLMLLLPHLAAIASLWVRWGALPIAICATIGCFFCSLMIFESLRLSGPSPIVFIVGVLFLLTSAMCHVLVRLRSEALSAR